MRAAFASSALVAEPCPARVLKRFSRSPSAARIVVVSPLVSPRTLPTESRTFSWSTGTLAIVHLRVGRKSGQVVAVIADRWSALQGMWILTLHEPHRGDEATDPPLDVVA